ncbi:MAG: disulfide bond formation protein B [Gammaproteobacteria bacterium]|nr:disulfide bond formation protein B [Gammaproteobacteria bacterium]
MGTRILYLFGFAVCAALIGGALYFQYVEHLEPCPLCIFQRIFIIVMAVVFLIAAIHNPRLWGRRVYGLLIALLSAIGAAIAARHVWLQNLPPDQVPECGPGLDFMLDAFPMSEVIQMVLSGSGECAEIAWMFLGISIPGWTLLIFGIFFVAALIFACFRPTSA